METYVLMTKLSPDNWKQLPDRAMVGREWLEHVKERCPEVRFIAHYALLGPYDFMDIYEAPDAKSAAKVSMISLANGALQAESWIALPYQNFLDISREI